jgi:hypothetical protein
MSSRRTSPSTPHPTITPSLEDLAALQGVVPLDDFDLLIGNPSPEDESAEEFFLMLREWRSEGRRNGAA